MSEWSNIEDDNIEINFKDKEIEIYMGYNDCGSKYIILTFEQIKHLNKTIIEIEDAAP